MALPFFMNVIYATLANEAHEVAPERAFYPLGGCRAVKIKETYEGIIVVGKRGKSILGTGWKWGWKWFYEVSTRRGKCGVSY